MRTNRTPALLAACALASAGIVLLVPASASSATDRPEFRSVTDPAPVGPFPRRSAATAVRPLESSLSLHSKVDAKQVIFLDFDGGDLAGTVWAEPGNGSLGTAGPFTLDGSATFSETELTAIQTVWQEVADDYAAFDVDVTTEDPGDAGIDRSSASDEYFGTKALVTSDATISSKMACGCSGKAYIGVYDAYPDHAYYQPAMVLPGALGNDAHNIAQTVSHEVGHNVGLGHDGVSGGSGYYAGVSNGLWAPIMGASFYNPMSQWSKGEYAQANNAQDDYAVMAANSLLPRTDEAGATPATASAMPGSSAHGVISSPTDADLWAVQWTCDKPLKATLTTASPAADLDASLGLLGPAGQVLATDDPAAARISSSRASGLGATVEQSVAGGITYYLRVDGVGTGTWAGGGYSDYGSLGAYALEVAGCTSPGAPSDFAAQAAQLSAGLRLSWQPPALDGGSPVTGYRVTIDSGDPVVLGADSREYAVDGLARGKDHLVTLQAVNATGAGTPVSLTRALLPVAGPAALTVTPRSHALRARWSLAESDDRAPVTGFRVVLRSKQLAPLLVTVGPNAKTRLFAGLDPHRRYRIVVRALTGATAGPAARSIRTRPLL